MEKKNAYVTFLFENDLTYLKGLFVLSKSLKDVKSKYPLVVALPKNSRKEFIEMVKVYSLNSKIILMDAVDASLNVPDEKYKYWELTVFRFNIARMLDYDKVVMIDSDMLVLHNIDDVFNYPHLSGVCSAQIIQPTWDMPNGGLLVFEPSIDYYNELIGSVNEVKKITNNYYNDQDVFHFTMKNWKERNELHIPEEYNEYWRCAGRLAKKLNNGWNDIKVLHYWGKEKIWNFSYMDKIFFLIKNIYHKRFDLNKCAFLYWKCLKKIKSCYQKYPIQA